MSNWEITEEAFEVFLAWLAPDREQAAQKYEEIRRRLIAYFEGRACESAEDLADQTIDLVIKQAPTLAKTYIGEPLRYFYGVARNVYRKYYEQARKKETAERLETQRDPYDPSVSAEKERYDRCLLRCLAKLPAAQRQLAVLYYRETGRAKIDHHQELATQLACTVEALRTRLSRLRSELRTCIRLCCQQENIL